MLLRILVTARNNLPPDSCLRLEEPAELQEALAHVEPIPQSKPSWCQTAHDFCSAEWCRLALGALDLYQYSCELLEHVTSQ